MQDGAVGGALRSQALPLLGWKGTGEEWAGSTDDTSQTEPRSGVWDPCPLLASWQTAAEAFVPPAPLLGSCQRVESIKRKDEENTPVTLQDGGDQRSGTSVLEGRTSEPR